MAILCIGIMLMTESHADDAARAAIFQKVDAAFKIANRVDANQLAPNGYGRAVALYKSANERYEKGQNLRRIQTEVDEAEQLLRQAAKSASIARKVLVEVIASRSNAIRAEAEKYSNAKWKSAEQKFANAASRLEANKEKAAHKLAEEAVQEYGEAELDAIKSNYLTETRALLAQAKKDKIGRAAPITLARAEQLLQEAEASLQANRYDIDQPRALAREARYEANHAISIVERVEPVSRRKKSLEELVLEMEEPVKMLASSLDMVVELHGSTADAIAPLRDEIARLQNDSYELKERLAEIDQLNSAIGELEMRLGMQSERLEKQERQQARLEQLQDLFKPEEATILKQGNDIIIRLIGLSFRTGSADIESEYRALLHKVQTALSNFPDDHVVVEGHTDSFGGDEANLALSEKRADSVRSYLLANLKDRSPASVTAKGFGESQPIANNETPAGRERNRRIDLMIRAR